MYACLDDWTHNQGIAVVKVSTSHFTRSLVCFGPLKTKLALKMAALVVNYMYMFSLRI